MYQVVCRNYNEKIVAESDVFEDYEDALAIADQYDGKSFWFKNEYYGRKPGSKGHLYMSVDFIKVFIIEV